MTSTRTYQANFSGGVISKERFGDVEDPKLRNGAEILRNFVPQPLGSAPRRGGFSLVKEVADSTKKTRLIPFAYSQTQVMVVEISAGKIKFHTNGGTLANGAAEWSPVTKYVAGQFVTRSGVTYICKLKSTNNEPPNATYWDVAASSDYEISNPYADDHIFDIHYVQSGNVVTLTHPSYPVYELRRNAAVSWELAAVTFGPGVTTPTGVSVAGTAGLRLTINNITSGGQGGTTLVSTSSNHNLADGDSIYVEGVTGTVGLPNGFYMAGAPFTDTTFRIKSYDGGDVITTSGTYGGGGKLQYATKAYDTTNYYVVTAISSATGEESPQSAVVSVLNNLYVDGSYNTISWSAVTGASLYRVYKQVAGLYGYIGQATSTSFVDNNISPSFSITPPIYDTVFASTSNYPSAVSYYDQRRVFAGTLNDPALIIMTRTGTESNVSSSLPIKDTDRISFRAQSREYNAIRHVVPMGELVLLTNAAEWRVAAVNNDALTPDSFSIRPQSYVGASNVQPIIAGNSLLFAADRGGHVFEFGYAQSANGFVPGDLSLRASHLFDSLSIVDMTMAKAPQQVAWFVSSSGNILSLTYVPAQQVGAWASHDTDGVFESVCAVPEGSEDRVYVVVKRTINGATKRFVERMDGRFAGNPVTSVFLDCAKTFNGANTGSTTITVTGGTTWDAPETLTLTASAATFAYPATTDVDDAIVITNGGVDYWLRIISTSSTTVAQAVPDRLIPVAARSATTSWAFARDTITGLSHLEGKVVDVLVDGAVHEPQTVASGSISLSAPGKIVHVGLNYYSDLKTPPAALAMDAYGRGTMKSISRAHVRVVSSGGVLAGQSESDLRESLPRTVEDMGSPPGLKTGELEVAISSLWGLDGSLFVRQDKPLPLTVTAMAIKVVVGG